MTGLPARGFIANHATRLLAGIGALVVAPFLLVGCAASTQTAQLPNALQENVVPADVSVIVTSATESLADARVHSSQSFLEVIQLADLLHEVEPEMVSQIPEDLASNSYEIMSEFVWVNPLATRAEVPVRLNTEDAASGGSTRLVMVFQDGDWLLDDVVEYYAGTDMSLAESIQTIYSASVTLAEDQAIAE